MFDKEKKTYSVVENKTGIIIKDRTKMKIVNYFIFLSSNGFVDERNIIITIA